LKRYQFFLAEKLAKPVKLVENIIPSTQHKISYTGKKQDVKRNFEGGQMEEDLEQALKNFQKHLVAKKKEYKKEKRNG